MDIRSSGNQVVDIRLSGDIVTIIVIKQSLRRSVKSAKRLPFLSFRRSGATEKSKRFQSLKLQDSSSRYLTLSGFGMTLRVRFLTSFEMTSYGIKRIAHFELKKLQGCELLNVSWFPNFLPSYLLHFKTS